MNKYFILLNFFIIIFFSQCTLAYASAHDVEYRKVLIEEKIETVKSQAPSQPSGGVNFPSSGGSFIVYGNEIPVPPEYNGFNCKLFIVKKIERTRYEVYERFVGTNTTWKYIDDLILENIISLDFEVEPVNY